MPRAGLTAERVIEQAEVLADESGLAGVTMAALAQRLGVRQPSLYKHVDGLAEVHHELSVRAKSALARVLADAAVGLSRDEALLAVSAAYREWAKQHPGRYAAAQRAPVAGDAADERASAEVAGVVFRILAGYGLSGDEAVHATRALRACLHGFVTLEAAGGFGLPTSIDTSYQRTVAMVLAQLDREPTLTQ